MKKQADRKDDHATATSRYTNRELSWLQFNERVLEESEDHRVPRYERLKFIAIFQSNLDEFFMVRVGSLFDQAIANKNEADPKYAQSIATNLTQNDFTFKSFGESFTGTFEEFSTDMVSTLGGDISYQQNRAEATSTVTNDFLGRRDQVSGVSRDEETANLLQYQKSYEAAARVMNVMDELLDVIINQMGL